LSGWVPGNDIIVKVWDASEDYEYTALATFEESAQWGDVYTVISELNADLIYQDIALDGVILNNISLNVVPENSDIDNILSNINVIIAGNDEGEYYIPENNVNTIGDWEYEKGLQILLDGFENNNLSVIGFAPNPYSILTLNPFMLNNVSYLLNSPTSVESAFSGLESILVVTDDQGHYYIPEYNLNTIDASGGMKPGKGYQVLISGTESIEFTYGDASDEGLTRSIGVVGSSNTYDITRTGISHPIIIDELTGLVSDGDELVAYAGGIAVGVATINTNDTNLLVAWKSLADYGIDTDGYYDGDEIELRLFSQELGKELMVTHSFNAETYGALPMTIGSIHVHNQAAVPGTFSLEQNYPNPFNPSTTIDVSVASDSQITLNIYDINGRLVSTLANDVYEAGYHSFVWNGLDQTGNKVSAGIYFYSLFAGEMTVTKKMMLMK
jgi:hypothetical protein